jgi:hypothetical protein
VRNLLRAALAVAFLFGQTAISFHHHDAAAASLRLAPSSRHATASVAPADDDCRLCAAQGMPSSPISTPPIVSLVAIEIAAPPIPPSDAPRAALIALVSDRSPPVL